MSTFIESQVPPSEPRATPYIGRKDLNGISPERPDLTILILLIAA